MARKKNRESRREEGDESEGGGLVEVEEILSCDRRTELRELFLRGKMARAITHSPC
jgi:hypothetical protein